MKRKSFFGLLSGLLVLGLIALAIGFWRGRAPKPDVRRVVFRSEENLRTFQAAQTVTAQRLNYRRESSESPWILENYVQDAAVAVAPEQAHALQRLLLQESSYEWGFAKMCAPQYGVLLTFRTGPSAIRVALCFECNMLGVFDTPDDHGRSINGEKDFDPARRSLVAIVKAIFPEDAKIQALR